MSEENSPRSGIYYVTPAEIFEDDALEWVEKAFYSLLSGIAYNDGYSYASDAYYAKRMKTSERTIKRWLQKLEKIGYIRKDTIKDGMYWKRKIFITHSKRKSKNVYEGTPMSPPKGHRCHDRRDTHVPIVSEELKVSEDIEKNACAHTRDAPLLEKGKFVRLKENDYTDLCNQWGAKRTERAIGEMNDYLESHGKKGYKDYAAALRNWLRRSFEKSNEGSQSWKSKTFHKKSEEHKDISSTKGSQELVSVLSVFQEMDQKNSISGSTLKKGSLSS